MSEEKNGQMVRISKVKGALDKGYIPNWSEEHYWFRVTGPSHDGY